jgi:predicted Zn-dependent protease
MAVKPRALVLSLLLCGPFALADGLPDLGESSQADLPPHVERRIGESIVRDIRLRDPAYVDDPEIQAYLNQLGNRLAAQSGDARNDFEFFAVRDNTLNAFALPGGFIGVHTGLILAAQSESELAGVLSHEIAHVTQRHMARMVGKQNQAQVAQWLALAVAILGSRSNSNISQGALAAGMAAGIQTQLHYSRDFEREADRVGFQILENAGFDVRGMSSFFERLQKFGRLYENNAPDYLLTHPLTTERISDMANRAQQRPYRQVADSLEFQLVRAKLKADSGAAADAVVSFQSQVSEKKYASAAAAYYGLARAQLRARNFTAAQTALEELRRLKVASPMVETLAGEIKEAQGDTKAALHIYREARPRYPRHLALTYALVETLLADKQLDEALGITSAELQNHPSDQALHGLQAKTYALMGKRLQQHRALAELYALRGQLPAAIEQLELAQKAKDGDFYELSAVDSRLRELRARYAEEMKEAKQR